MLIKHKLFNVFIFTGSNAEFKNLCLDYSLSFPTRHVWLVDPHANRKEYSHLKNVKIMKSLHNAIRSHLDEGEIMLIDSTLTNISSVKVLQSLSYTRRTSVIVVRAWKNEVLNVLTKYNRFEIRAKKNIERFRLYK